MAEITKLDLVDPELLGEMVRWFRKMGHKIPKGQPRTSQDGIKIANVYNKTIKLERSLKVVKTKLKDQ